MKITSLEELRKLASESDGCSCYISFGVGHSSKHITYDEEYGWNVLHLVDDTETLSTDDELLDNETNIVDAIKNGCLYTDD